jgi:hypothetical protein
MVDEVLGVHPALLAAILFAAGIALLWHWRERDKRGRTRPHRAHWLPVLGAIDPELYWGFALCCCALGALLMALPS